MFVEASCFIRAKLSGEDMMGVIEVRD